MAKLFERLFPLLWILTSAAMLCITEINKHKKYTRHDEHEIFIFKPLRSIVTALTSPSSTAPLKMESTVQYDGKQRRH